MPENDNAGGASNGGTETIDQIHDAHIAAFEAYQADPTKPELKEAAAQATAKWKERFAADKKAREEAAASSKPPEKYDLKPPKESKLEQKDVDAIAELAKANKLSVNAAQAVLERINADREAYVESLKNELHEEQKQWLEQFEKDPEIGGDKAKHNAELIKRVHEKFASPEFVKLMDDTGYGNNPEYARMIVCILKAANFSEDKLVMNGEPVKAPTKDAAKAMFPNMAKQLGRE